MAPIFRCPPSIQLASFDGFVARPHGHAAIHDLPNEILNMIFVFAVEGDPPRTTTSEAPINITRTCSRWRQLAKAEAALWQCLLIGTGWTSNPARDLAAMRTFVARSRNRPLSFQIYYGGERRSLKGDGYGPFVYLSLPKDFQPVISYLVSLAARWDSIVLEIDHVSVFKDIFGAYRSGASPVKHLKLVLGEVEQVPVGTLELGDVQSLESFEFSLRQTVDFTLTVPPALSTQNLRRFHSDVEIAHTDCLVLFDRCRQLEDVQFRPFVAHDHDERKKALGVALPVPLPNLKRLFYNNTTYACWLDEYLGDIDTPNLEELEILINTEDAISWPEWSSMESKQSLRTLRLRSFFTDHKPGDFRFLRHLKHLRILEVLGAGFGEALIEAVIYHLEDPNICPSLESIALSGMPCDDVTVDHVCSLVETLWRDEREPFDTITLHMNYEGMDGILDLPYIRACEDAGLQLIQEPQFEL